MSKSTKKSRFRKNLKQFLKLKTAGKLNGKAAVIEGKLKDSAEIAGLNYDEEYEAAYMSTDNSENTRENPVEVPFTMTLNELDKLHKMRSIKKLNSFVGFKQPCFTARHQGVKENAHLSFFYDADYNKKVYTLMLLLDGQKEAVFCAKGQPATFKTVWKKMLKEYGDLEFVIKHQDHAKKALGAKEYARQEREYAKKQKKKSKKTSSKVDKKGNSKTEQSSGQQKSGTGNKAGAGQPDTPATAKEAKVGERNKKSKKESKDADDAGQRTRKKEEKGGTGGTSGTGSIDVDKAEKQQEELKSLFQSIMGD
jgi:hypothetical protein